MYNQLIFQLNNVSILFSALTVRYLTRRYIGEYRSNTGMYRKLKTVLTSALTAYFLDCSKNTRPITYFVHFHRVHSYNMKPLIGAFGQCSTKINHTDSSDANRNVTVTCVIYWNGIYSLRIIYYFTMSRSRCKFH